MNNETVSYNLRQLHMVLNLIGQYKENVKDIELILTDIGALRNLLNLNDNFWIKKFDELINKIFWKNEWIIITLDKDKEFFPNKNISIDDEEFIKQSYLEIVDLFRELSKHVNLKINELEDNI